jgi:hypothetical protein
MCGWLIPLTPDSATEREMFMFSSEVLINLCEATLESAIASDVSFSVRSGQFFFFFFFFLQNL